tara:strand:+ start:922 stop:4476 length:3555 start_codon:yes stop_codon:yes gene_type:complete
MSSSNFNSLKLTLNALRRRRNLLLFIRFFSIFCVCASGLFLGASGVIYAVSPDKLLSLLITLLFLIALGLVLWRLVAALFRSQGNDLRLAHYVEDRFPDLEQRLLTSLEFSDEDLGNHQKGVSSQFVRQLWKDAEQHVAMHKSKVESTEPFRESGIAFATAVASLLVCVLLSNSSENWKKASLAVVWPFDSSAVASVEQIVLPLEISVEPGDVRQQRGDDLTVLVRIMNSEPNAVNLRLQQDRVNWVDFPMTLESSEGGILTYSYYFSGVEESGTYYISFNDMGDQTSREYAIDVYELPRVEQIDVAFSYPQYTGLEDKVQEDNGDIFAPEGTKLDLTFSFNKSIDVAVVEFVVAEASRPMGQNENEEYPDLQIEIDPGGLTGSAQFIALVDGLYRVTATDREALDSGKGFEYFIRVKKDQPPSLELLNPGRDQEVMPLEEVGLRVDAIDDYGLSEFTFNYSVAGGREVAVDFLQQTQSSRVEGAELLYLEELDVEPGDFISYHFEIADNNGLIGPTKIISDIYFLQVVPTDQEFRRAQQQGGGGGGGQGAESSALVTIQKDVISATWKLRNRQDTAEPQNFSDDAKIISESQREATGRVRMSIDRLSERLSFSDDSYDSAVENLSLAIEQMNIAAGELDLEQVTSALRPEQLALQYILKAEANINRTDISMQQSGSGGSGGGAQQEREDLRELFEMELGQLENRYETPQSRSGPSAGAPEENDKLEELARRQESLTKAQRNLSRRGEQLSEEQKRRELERLRRQQEQLSNEVDLLARAMSDRNTRQNQSEAESRDGSRGEAGSENLSQAREPRSVGGRSGSLQRAADQMRDAAQSDSASLAAARSQKALESLRQQQRELQDNGNRSIEQVARNLAGLGGDLLQKQRALQEELSELIQSQGLGQTRREASRDSELQSVTNSQQQQQRDLDDIEDMLRAVIARGNADDQRLLSRAQSAVRDLRPIRDDMQTSNRVLRNGMASLAADMEAELEEKIESFAQSLAELDPRVTGQNPSKAISDDAELLQAVVTGLEEKVALYSADSLSDNSQDNTNQPSLSDMRDQLAQAQRLAENLSRQLTQQSQNSGVGGVQQRNGNEELGNARSVRQELTRSEIEDFLAQPELLRALIDPIVQLSGALRARAELESVGEKLFLELDQAVPTEYRDLVKEYYKALSEVEPSETGAF